MTNAPTRILVVDDAPLIRGLLEQALQKYGYRVTIAEDGQQAIEFFLKYHPDLILMDADMPVLDGVTACARIKALSAAKNLPIIMVTAFVEGQWVDRAYAAGATDYITKPINLDVLRNRIHYILQAKQAEEALFDEKEKAQVTLASICDGVITTDAKGRVEFLNSAATKLTGWTTEEAQGLPLNQIYSIWDENTQQPMEFPLQHCLVEGQMVEFSHHTLLIHRNQKQKFAVEDSAAPIKDRHGYIIGVVLVFHDVTETRKMTQELSYKAKHDALTGLYNLHEFKAQLDRLLQTPPNPHTEHALLYMDLDQFKIVNDTCGHEAGDQLLKEVALILQRQIEIHIDKTQATLARLGGDEFGLLLENCTSQHALYIAHYLRECIENFRFFWENSQKEKGIFTIGISIGMVPFSMQTLNPKSILAKADAACYMAKNAGRNNVHIYQENSTFPTDQNIQWVSLINENLEKDNGFSLFYQLIKPLLPKDSSTLGKRYEILLRMQDPHGHLVPLGAFLSAATRYNLMSSIDLWVIRHWLKWLNSHPEHMNQLILATLRISGHALSDPNFVPAVVMAIQESDIPAYKLCFEVYETTAMTNLTGVLEFMSTLRPLGCCFSLGDFSSGMAAFSFLKMLPIDFLKLDGNFIKSIIKDKVDYATVKAMNEIAHLMHFQTIAQGVENAAIFEKLTQLEVDYVQGNWVHKPQLLYE